MDEHCCTWTEDENGPWDTACGESYEINDGTPEDNNMAFCCFCGKALKQKLFEGGDE